LNVVRIHVPALRDRRGDIPELIEFFIEKANRELGMSFVGVTDDARELLVRHRWPGNVRELENAILRAAVLARGGRTLVRDDFQLAGQPRAATADALPLEEAVRRRLADLLAADGGTGDLHALVIGAVERPLIEVVLERAGGNQVKAAEMLGINRNTLRKRITELGIEVRRGPMPRG
jgi:two-component system nitrogen regulation response regulator GlnG